MAMWFHLLEQGRLACIPEPLTYIRQHKSQITQDNRRTGQLVEDKKRIFSAYIDKPYVRKTALRVFLWRLRTAYNVWKGVAGDKAGQSISGFLPPVWFYVLLPAVLVTDLLRHVLRRVRAIRYVRQVPGANS